MYRHSLLNAFLLASLAACASKTKPPQEPKTHSRSSHSRLYDPVPVEKVDITVGAERAGHSLVVKVSAVGRGHASGQALEDSKAWHVSASYGNAPLKQVLAGPAKVSRAPTGAALGDQWDIEIQFMVAFALPDRALNIEVRVQAPTGEETRTNVSVEAPLEKLSSF